ncbi:MAG TPA: MFS transporter [Burkholderiaceae bacterium]|nr:MFS transporter [Burkholderiaceae bacterium]
MSLPGAPLSVSLWMGAVVASATLALMAAPVLAPSIARDLDLSPEWVGLYSGTVWGSALLISAWAGRIVERLGAWQTSRLCAVLCALGVAAAATAHPLGLLVSAVLIGLGNGVEAPPASQVLAQHVPPVQRPLYFSLKQSGVQAGAVLASMSLPLQALWLGWQGALLSAALMVAIIAAALTLPMGRHPAHRPQSFAATRRRAGWRAVLRANPALARLAIAAGAFGATQVCLNSFIVTFLVRERGLELAHAGWVAAFAQGCGLIGRLLWGWVASRIMPSMDLLRLLGCVMIVSALALGTLGASMNFGSLLAVAGVFGLTASGWNGVFLAEVAERSPPDEIGATTGAVMVLMMAGLVSGPLLFATVARFSSLGGAYAAVSLIALSGTLALPGRRVRA